MEKSVFLVFCVFTSVNCILINYNCKINQNNSLLDIQFENFNDNIHDTVEHAIVKTFVVINDIFVHLKIKINKDRENSYDLELVNTIADVKKLLKGSFANSLFKTSVMSMFQNLSFEPKFPLKPVDIYLW